MEPSAAHDTRNDSVRDLVLSVVAYGCLYWFVGSLVWLAFVAVDHHAPDPLAQRYNYYGDLVDYAVSPNLLASTLVAAAAAIVLMRLARKSRAAESGVAASRILARLLLYVSLAAVFVTLAADLVYALRGFFAADLPMNAALKALAVAAFSAVAGWYLLALLPGSDEATGARRGKAAGIIAAVVTLALVATGAIANNRDGASLRDLRLDARRVQDLQQIQSSVISHWDYEGGPVASLAVLESDFNLTLPRDPETGEAYGYEDLGTGTESGAGGRHGFILCATFAASSTEKLAYDPYFYPMASRLETAQGSFDVGLPEYGWSHGPGKNCFERVPVLNALR